VTNDLNVAETLAEIRGRVTERLSRTVPEIPELALPAIDPLRQARMAAESWAGSMGGPVAASVRGSGSASAASNRRSVKHATKKILARVRRWRVLQASRRMLGRGLRWILLPQMQFNDGVIAALVRTEDMFADVNRNMIVLGQNLAERRRREAELERSVHLALAEMKQSIGRLETDLQGVSQAGELVMQVFRGQIEEIDRSVNVSLQLIHKDVGRVEGHVNQVQQSFWEAQESLRNDFGRVRQEVEADVRLVRQRLLAVSVATSAVSPGTGAATAAAQIPSFDYAHFERYFRGEEVDIRRRQLFYLPMLRETLRETPRDNAAVLDLACGRGEMLELLREQGIEARGVDLDLDMVARCQAKNLQVERADALKYLEDCAEASLGAVFSAQFVEHLPMEAYSRLTELSFSRLRSGGRLILETQNPECLAIFSQSFYLDPTHVRPVPAQQLRFLLKEAGFGDIEVHYLSPVEGAGLPQLPMQGGNEAWNTAAAKFNETYFGYMDYCITGIKPN
jgi:SAM-dependent methyltransferase